MDQILLKKSKLYFIIMWILITPLIVTIVEGVISSYIKLNIYYHQNFSSYIFIFTYLYKSNNVYI